MSEGDSPPPFSQVEVEVGDSEPMDDDSVDMVPLPKFNLPANADSTVELWRTKMEEGVLASAHFLDYWRITVPRVYGPQLNRNCLDWSWDEEVAEKLLIKPLEDLIWGPSGKTGAVGQRPRRATLCGRVFKNGEPAYSCRECGLDNTCVLCVECFKVSEHRNHKYKMSQSAGGGCCDCGDVEAWKSDPYCQIHMATGDENADVTSLPDDVIQRMKLVTTAVLNYAFNLLTLDHAPGLPNDLRPKDNERDPLQILDQPDLFCTVLYNDETHTFDQVITTLVRVLKCQQRDAVELVSHIDREGRAMVKCDNYQDCDKLRLDIERFTSRHGPELKVLVMHDYVIAHQAYAMRLLEWLTSFVANEASLRLTVARVVLGEDGNGHAQGVMQNDCKLWKAARTLWHRLLITTMLMDYETKKALAILFTKNYGSIVKDYIRDDHDHSFSISSLAVQLFTTPTLAHRLIAENDALFIVLHTFLSECNNRVNSQGRLEFDRNNQMMAFKRAQYILYDVKYLLSSVPTEWTDPLRRGFLHGFSLLLDLLALMQGTDAISRQVGHHMEFEPEWESAFNLHVKLAHGVSLALLWCASDKVVSIKAYRLTMKKLVETEKFPEAVVKELGEQSARVIPYDVSSQPVSIHLALSRMAAALELVVQKHGLSYHAPEFSNSVKPAPEELIEPVLRTVSMVAQVHAGMWRRNGYALLNQLYFYHNVKCRGEMLDRDILMLQIGANLIGSDELIIHILNKFGLLPWSREDFEETSLRSSEDDSMRHTIGLVEEFLGLLITMVGSRYVPGIGKVTQADKTKKEIIQALCVKPMAHSELNKTLPEDELHETGLENVINEVATFTKPVGPNTRGIYTLKEHLYEEYDTFYYHYTKEELSKSEEVQRAYRKSKGLPECCPPPSLPELTEPFRLLAGLLQSDAAMYVIRTILRRAVDLRARSFSETLVNKVLHLIGYALRDEESGHYEFLSFAEKARRADILNLLRQLSTSKRVEAHRPLIVWTMEKLRSLVGESEESKDEDAMQTENEAPPTGESEEDKESRARRAAERREILMAQMKAAQNSFMSNNASLFTEGERCEPEVEATTAHAQRKSGPALGTRITVMPPTPRVCIMCQEEATVELDRAPLVLVAFVQFSSVYNRNREVGQGLLPEGEARAWLPSGLGAAPHVSSCGHALHAHCWNKYIESVALKENRRPYRLRQPAAFDVDKQEYLCPLCERLCNAALPLIPASDSESELPPLSESAFASGVALILNTSVEWSTVNECSESCAELHCIAKAAVHVCTESCSHTNPVTEGGDGVPTDGGGSGEPERLMCTQSREMLPSELMPHLAGEPHNYLEATVTLIRNFANSVRSACSSRESEAAISSLPSAVYRALSYTIHATDHLIMLENRPLLGGLPARHADAVSALVRLAAALPSVWAHSAHLAHHALSSLNALLKGSPLSCDALGALVPCMLGTPALLGERGPPAGPGAVARHLALLAFRSQLAKALITVPVSHCTKDEPMEGCDFPDEEDLSALLDLVFAMRKERTPTQHLCPKKVWYEIKEECIPFLRRCCLLAHFLSDVQPPKELTQIGEENFENMCQYLNLPHTYRELLCTEWAMSLLKDWTKMEETEKWLEGELKEAAVREARFPPQLVQLPEDYSELINIVSTFTCPNSERDDSKYPTMCLVCGEMLCSQSYCCQMEMNKINVGACVSHVVACGGGAGVLLRVRDCELLLLAAPNRGALLHAPYLDCYGETDQNLKRGNPLKLCKPRYEEIRHLWLSHGIHEKIARSLDSTSLVPPIWQHM